MPRWARWSVALVIGAIALSVGPRAHAQATVVLACGTPPATLPLGTVQPFFQDATGKLCTGATLTGGSTTLNATAFLTTLGAGTQTPQGSLAGANYVQPVFGSASGGGTQVDATHGLPTNCIAGCAGGTSSNASDNVATSSTNGQTLAWLYAWNGSSWDRLRDDASKNLDVNLAANSFGALAVTGTFWQATQPVSGTFWQATQPISAASLPLPTGAATSALQSTINTTLGSPFQAGGSIGNTSFGATQSGTWTVQPGNTPNSTAWLVTGTGGTFPVTGTFWQATQPVSGTVTANEGGAPWTQNVTQWGSTNVVTGGVAGSVGVGGLAASGASVSGNPLQGGGRAQSAEATAVTNGQEVAAAFDLYGKQVTSPWANRENYLSGAASTTAGTATTLIASQGAGFKIYVTSAQCFRTDAGTTIDYVTLNDTASTTIPVPAGGGAAPKYNTPLSVAAATALTFTANSAVSTMFCNAQGYKGA